MTRALWNFGRVALAAFSLGVYGFALAGFFYLSSGDAVWFEASLALAGGALIAGIFGAAAWAARAILRTERNMAEVLDRLPRLAADAPYVEDDSEQETRAAMKRARDRYERRLEPSYLQQRGAM